MGESFTVLSCDQGLTCVLEVLLRSQTGPEWDWEREPGSNSFLQPLRLAALEDGRERFAATALLCTRHRADLSSSHVPLASQGPPHRPRGTQEELWNSVPNEKGSEGRPHNQKGGKLKFEIINEQNNFPNKSILAVYSECSRGKADGAGRPGGDTEVWGGLESLPFLTCSCTTKQKSQRWFSFLGIESPQGQSSDPPAPIQVARDFWDQM